MAVAAAAGDGDAARRRAGTARATSRRSISRLRCSRTSRCCADGRLKILGYFLGLYGPHGPLPLHLTEYVHDRITNARDSTLAGFTDIFHHRMLELFYRAWANARPTVHFDRPHDDRFAGSYVAALMGLASPALRNRDEWPDRAKLYLFRPARAGTKTRGGLESLLREYLDLPLHIEECVGEWLPVEPDECLRLGDRGHREARVRACSASASGAPSTNSAS